jgi:CRISPR/Cas system-associated exonuclease Cas4 (RecB family)
MCPQQYFFEYVLGMRGPSNKKADKGTICHKVLEILAGIKLSLQNKEKLYNDDILGDIDTKKYNLDKIIDQIYTYYSTQFKHHEWEVKDLKDCHKWVYKALNDHNGTFDPRNRDIVQPEQHFDIVIDKPWAKYKYNTKEGFLEGNLAIKGTIDLITKVNDSTLEIIDWKTGKRLDWATGEEKTLAKLQNDPQLRIYHYAVSALYPDIDHVIVSINFINDGGAFSICYDRSDLSYTENMIRKKFDAIKNTKVPQLNRTWKCNKLCHFGKTTFEDTNISPLIEYRDGQICDQGKRMTKCEQVKHDIALKGIDRVVDEYTVPGYSVGKYKAPGSAE